MASINVKVLHNQNGPTFIPSSTYKQTLLEDALIGQTVLQVTAQDLDSTVSHLRKLKISTPWSIVISSCETVFLLSYWHCDLQDEIEYSIISASDNGADFFLLEAKTGIVRLRKPLDGTFSSYSVNNIHLIWWLVVYKIVKIFPADHPSIRWTWKDSQRSCHSGYWPRGRTSILWGCSVPPWKNIRERTSQEWSVYREGCRSGSYGEWGLHPAVLCNLLSSNRVTWPLKWSEFSQLSNTFILSPNLELFAHMEISRRILYNCWATRWAILTFEWPI